MYSNSSVPTYRQRSMVLLAWLLVTVTATHHVLVDAFHVIPAAAATQVSFRSEKNTMCFSTNKAEDDVDVVDQTQQQQQQQPGGDSGGGGGGGDSGDSNLEVQTWNPLRLAVLRLGFTEPAWSSPLNYGAKVGTFSCAYCGQELFESTAKYDSGSGWPSFWRSINDGAISYKMEYDGRLECQCGRCKSHLGHVFPDGPRENDVPVDLLQLSPPSDPRGKQQGNTIGRLPRYCVNGASINWNRRD